MCLFLSVAALIGLTWLYSRYEPEVNAFFYDHRAGLIGLAGLIAWISFITLLGTLERVLGISMEGVVGIWSIWPLIFLCFYAEKSVVGRAIRIATGITVFALIVGALVEG